MEERSLKVIDSNVRFFGRISNTITKLLSPTKIGINGLMISLKRSSMIKAFETYMENKDNNDSEKRDATRNRYEEAYSLYLESIDKYIIDSLYKKVKNNIATQFERDAISKYYTIVRLKENQYIEYKYRKQKYLIELDYESIKMSDKTKLFERYIKFYLSKMDSFYKGILKNYSVQLADSTGNKKINTDETYENIFETLEDYISNILPIKLDGEEKEEFSQIISDYEEFEKFQAGKLDNRDILEKKMILLGLSRKLFTHSLPLVAAEQCYKKLITDSRNLILTSKNTKKKEEAYEMLLTLLKDYNIKLLSTKVYWENLNERENYKTFWDKYSKAKDDDEKQILFLKDEVKVQYETNGNKKLIQYYKSKLVEFGVMKTMKKPQTLKNKNFTKKDVA